MTEISEQRRGFGWLKDPPDYRDYRYGPPRAVLTALPAAVDLRGGMPKIYDQGNLGSCTANAGNAVVQFVEKSSGDPDQDRLSRLWTYWYAREKIGLTNEDSGAYLRDTFKVLAERGAPREKYWPYNIERFADEPDAGERSAPHHRVLEYRSVNDGSEQDMRACLAEGFPFAYGFAVYDSFESIGSDGWWRPQPGEGILGYHAVVCVGYDMDGFIVRNSWGYAFGDRGHFRVPYGHMAAEAFDCWTVRTVTRDP